MVAHVIPIRLSARDIFVRCFAILVLTAMTQPFADESLDDPDHTR